MTKKKSIALLTVFMLLAVCVGGSFLPMTKYLQQT